MSGLRAADPGPMEADRLTIGDAVREIRLQAGRMGQARRALERLLKTFEQPSEAAIQEMREGARPLSPEVHLLGALQKAVFELESCEVALRIDVEKRELDRLEKEWTPGRRPRPVDLQSIEEAVAALRDGAGGRR